MTGINKKPEVTLEALERIFTVPEDENTTLGRIERDISRNLLGFLKEHIVAPKTQPADLERSFLDTSINEDPIYVSEQAEFLLQKVVKQSVHVSSPSFIGHMTSALPYFMLPLAKIMIALNQNLVKIETSKAFTPLERQVIGMLHRLIFERNDGFYNKFTQSAVHALGAFTSDGTIANITALWVALNRLFAPQKDFKGIGDEGLFAALQHYKKNGLAILVSERGHYSLRKAANILGIGRKNLIAIPTDEHNRILLPELEKEIARLKSASVGIVAIVGIAGTTETGNVDPLDALADICEREKIHFHVDAAWGGPTLFSTHHKHILKGVERADSVTFDAHKQLYVPIGAGVAIFRDESMMNLIAHHAEYIIRRGSRDLGKMTLEGSRPGMAMLVHSALRIMGRRGFELLIDQGIAKAKLFAQLIAADTDFELVTEPELNLLTYRYVPAGLKKRLSTLSADERVRLNERLNGLTVAIQKEQRDSGRSFVSRTALRVPRYDRQRITVFRTVLANPLTTEDILREILAEQKEIGRTLLGSDFKDLAAYS